MRTGVSYMGHHSPKHLEIDLKDMATLQLDDVLLAAQENDFLYFPGTLKYFPQIARDHGIRPLAIFWGALNLFGGGRSSQFLLEHPEGFQVTREGKTGIRGCHANPICRQQIKNMIDVIAEYGFEGYFVDEPTPLRECYCPSCKDRFAEWYEGELHHAEVKLIEEFRQRCVIDYIEDISRYCKQQHPKLETICCLMPWDKSMWKAAAEIKELDNLGTDIYWINEDRDVEEMRPIIQELDSICTANGKKHHEWLQCWDAKKGNEHRIFDQGKILTEEPAEALYVWAYDAQIGVSETCEDPETAWQQACKVLRLAKEK